MRHAKSNPESGGDSATLSVSLMMTVAPIPCMSPNTVRQRLFSPTAWDWHPSVTPTIAEQAELRYAARAAHLVLARVSSFDECPGKAARGAVRPLGTRAPLSLASG
jgi:hypothetical protein